MSAMRPLLIDIHTHIYTPRLVNLLRKRTRNPRIHGPAGSEKLAILPDEVDGGRPVGPQYWDRAVKVSFMDRHRIDASVISLANPWLDFLPASEAIEAAKLANEDLEEWCKPSKSELDSTGNPSGVFSAGDARSSFTPALPPQSRIRAFGILPFSQDVPTSELVSSLEGIAKSNVLKGAIIGTRGRGKGLDDPELEALWESAEKHDQPLFLHPHYGVGSDSVNEDGLFGGKSNGHVLPLALGFPFETASAAARLILAGVFDRYPSLKLILAHSGGALPFLSSRLSSCIAHDPHVASRLQHDARYYMGKLYYDAVCYGPEELEFVAKTIGRSDRYKRGGSGMAVAQRNQKSIEAEELKRGLSKCAGFGSDAPFFPSPPSEAQESSLEQPLWRSVTENLNAINSVSSFDQEDRANIMGGNAEKMFGFR